MRKTFKICLMAFIILVGGCATTTLQTDARMTQSIFLDPVAKNQRTVFVNIKNTSGHNINLESKIINGLKAKGYEIVDDPEKATYILSTNVLYCDKKSENNTALGATALGATGVAISGYNGNGAGGVVAAGLAGAVVGGVIGKLTEDTIWQMQVDIDIKQKIKTNVVNTTGNLSGQADVQDSPKSGFLNSFGGNVRRNDATGKPISNQYNTNTQTFSSNYIQKKTMIFAEATKVGLELPEATPILEDKIAAQIVGIF